MRACERDIADAALLAAGLTGGQDERARTAAGLALRAFATHPLIGSLDAARSLAAATVPMPPHLT